MRIAISLFATASSCTIAIIRAQRDSPPILCLHGLTRNARDFADFAERHSPRFRVIALEFRGRAESDYDPLPMRYNPLTYAGDVIELLDQLGIDQAIFVGTSLGGLVTMAVAAMQPQRIAAAILNDVGPALDAGRIDRIQSYVGKDTRFRSWDEAADGDRCQSWRRFDRLHSRRLGRNGAAQLPRGQWRDPVRL